MDNLSVSVRIIGGYTVVVILAAAIAITGYLGINGMRSSFSEVTEKAMPMSSDSGALITHTLLANRKLIELEKSSDLSKLSEIEAEFDSLINNNKKISTSLNSLLADSPALSKLFNQSESSGKLLVEKGKEMMSLHREALGKASTVADLKMEFGDMGDETLSFVYDMQGEVTNDTTLDSLSNLETEVEMATSSVNDALRTGIKMAVLEVRSELGGRFDDIGSILNNAANSPELAGSDSIKGAKDAYARQKTAANNLLAAYMAQLDAESAVEKSFNEAEQSANQVITQLTQLMTAVDKNTEATKANTESVISNSQTSLIIFALIALVVSIAVALLITRSIRHPLNEIVEKIKTLATGDLRIDFSAQRQDELGQLAMSMQELVTQLRSILSSISSNSEQLAATAEESSSISKQTYQNVAKQKEQTDQMVTSVNQMTATVGEVSNSANQTLSEVESAYNEMTSGESVLKQNIERFQKLSEDIKNGANVIQELNDDSKNIGGVLDVIKGIAEQTNLLALNAAIEAARAGEQGRGFAVVADEVRSLASRSQDSTAEIEDMISRLQSRAKEAVNVMESSEDEAQHSVESISEAGATLQKVTQAISAIKDMSYQIASAAEEQAAASQSQLENITLIANASDENATASQENLTASEELASMADKQRSLVAQFKL